MTSIVDDKGLAWLGVFAQTMQGFIGGKKNRTIAQLNLDLTSSAL
jgi:hypothetical protein